MTEVTKKIPGLAELIRNRKAFEKQEAKLKLKHTGKLALFVNEELIEIFEDEEKAYEYGYAEFGYGKFTLHEIGAEPVNCGSARPYSFDELKADGLV